MVMGTVGYMSPEQVKGQNADHRSDLFSFGAILYEMLSGKRAFSGETSVETMSAILKQDPPELTETNRTARLPRWSGSCATAWRRIRKSASSRRGMWLSIWRISRRFQVAAR